jgi:putative acetyltransferase
MIRAARPEDHEAIVAVTADAFKGQESAIRIVREVEPEISLVYEEAGEVVGHVMLSRMAMADSEHCPLQLSPLSVASAEQRRGIGSALTREAVRLADERAEPLVLVLGIPEYYPRFGFRSARELGLEPPDPEIPDGPWMVLPLRAYDPAIRGTVVFPPAFG